MKKISAFLAAVICLTFTGCSNAFAKNEYGSMDKIAEGDRYAAMILT